MKYLQCNCLTKTPEPKYHMQNCPVWMADRIEKLEDALRNIYEELLIITNQNKKVHHVLQRDGKPACNTTLHHALKNTLDEAAKKLFIKLGFEEVFTVYEMKI